MGCYCNKTKQIQQSQSKEPQILSQKTEQPNLTQSTSDQNDENYDQIRPPKQCFISNINQEIKKNHKYEREIGGKKEIFSQLYIRPFKKK